MYHTGEQWDAPNGWPPLQHMLIEGAATYGGPAGEAWAKAAARRWVGCVPQTGPLYTTDPPV